MSLVLGAAALGILTGGVYALMASGLTLIFGVMRIINVGHGALVILGAYASFAVFGFHITYVYVFGFLLCLAILGALFLVLYRTAFGSAIRATMLNRTAAQLIGIDVERVSALAFGIGVATAAAGGVVFGITNAFNPGSHYDLISRLLTIIVLGGLGSLRGAIIAALIMLVTEDITAVLISPVWANFVFFVILVTVLIVRPQGLYGVRVRDRI